MNVNKNLLTKNDCYKSGRRINPVGMQLHTIGTAQNSASSLASYWNQSGVEACVHYCIDAETEGKILQFLPDNYRSWADGGYGNGNLITVELMESDYMKYTAQKAAECLKISTEDFCKLTYENACRFYGIKE